MKTDSTIARERVLWIAMYLVKYGEIDYGTARSYLDQCSLRSYRRYAQTLRNAGIILEESGRNNGRLGLYRYLGFSPSLAECVRA